VLNWAVLTTPATLDLVVAQVQAPLGVVMLGASGVLVALFFVAYLQNQISSLLETRRLLKEIQRVQELADKAEASRIENLHQLMATEFRLLHERIGGMTVAASPVAEKEARPAASPLHSGLLPPAF
jgi:hypothetical protein